MAILNASTTSIGLNYLGDVFLVDTRTGRVAEIPVQTATQFSESMTNGYRFDEFGTFTYSGARQVNGFVYPDLDTEVITGFNAFYNGNLVYSFSGANVRGTELKALNDSRGAAVLWLSGNDTISLGSGADLFAGFNGNDTIDGGAGADTAVYFGNSTNYEVTKTSSGYVVRDKIGTDGTDLLTNIEMLAFDDKIVTLSQLDRVSKFFVAYYGRPGASAGLDYWLNALNGSFHGDETQLVWNFGNKLQPEFANLYSSAVTEQDFIARVFNNLFNRTPNQAGLDYWTGIFDFFKAQGLDDDTIRGKMVTWIMDGAADNGANLDLTTLNNKAVAASAFTGAIDTPSEISGYRNANNTAALNFARDWLHQVDGNSATLASHTDIPVVDQAVAQMVGLYTS